MKLSKTSGVTLAAAAAALLLGGTMAGAPTASAQDAKVKCYGANACKGKNDCKTVNNACKGKNSCKGQGFVMLSEKDCLAKVTLKG